MITTRRGGRVLKRGVFSAVASSCLSEGGLPWPGLERRGYRLVYVGVSVIKDQLCQECDGGQAEGHEGQQLAVGHARSHQGQHEQRNNLRQTRGETLFRNWRTKAGTRFDKCCCCARLKEKLGFAARKKNNIRIRVRFSHRQQYGWEVGDDGRHRVLLLQPAQLRPSPDQYKS